MCVFFRAWIAIYGSDVSAFGFIFFVCLFDATTAQGTTRINVDKVQMLATIFLLSSLLESLLDG